MCISHILYPPPPPHQARSFCRGIIARSAHPDIRLALLVRLNADDEELSHLRSFLDLGSKRRGWRKTKKGSGTFSWIIHTHNSLTGHLRDIHRLKDGADKYFFECSDFPRRMILSRKVTLIHTSVSINGFDWHAGNICEYVGHDGTLRIGKIYLYAVVGYRADGEAVEEGQTLFVQTRPFHPNGMLARDSCGAYTFKTDALTSVRRKCWIHASRMCTYMFKPKGTDRTDEERRMSVKIVPVATAFARD
jgi:hypothetical protein